MELSSLRSRLDVLAVFRPLLDDPALRALHRYLASPDAPGYGAFACALYMANGGDLGAHIRTLISACETVCVRTLARGEPLPPHLVEAQARELETLQAVADLSPAALAAPLGEVGALPGWTFGGERLAPAYDAQLRDLRRKGYGVFAQHTMFTVDDAARLVPVAHPDPVALRDLVDYERERAIVLENTRALLAGKPAANLLLTGDAGTGKSSTVKAVANALAPEGLRLAELRRDQLALLPALLERLSDEPMRFVVFIDDLSFGTDDAGFNALKAALEGSLTARSRNVCIYATSNRRHLVKERFSDREGDDVHVSDTMQELRSLSDRFGRQITFSKPDKTGYLHIVRTLADQAGLALDDAALCAAAERAALHRGGRSARLARQVVDALLCGQEL